MKRLSCPQPKDFLLSADIFITVIQDEEKLHGCRNKVENMCCHCNLMQWQYFIGRER